MTSKDVAVLSFDFKWGDQKPSVQAMIWLTPEAGSEPEVTYTDLTDEELECLVQTAHTVELRLFTGATVSPQEELTRTQQMQSLYKSLSKKYGNLHKLELQAANYDDGQLPLELQNQIANEKRAIAELEARLSAL